MGFVLRIVFFLLLILITDVSCSRNARKRTTPYVIAQNNAWEFLNLYEKEKNITGFSDDLLAEISKIEKIDIQTVATNKTPIVSLLRQNGIDGVLSALAPDEQNMRRYDFSVPYFVLGPVLVVRQNDPAHTLEEMGHREIGFERGYFWALQLANTTDAIFDPYNDVMPAFDDLKRGVIDGLIVDSMVAYRVVGSTYKGILRVAGPPLASVAIRLIVQKGKNKELLDHFNHGLEAVKKSGLYLKILRYWDLFDAMDPSSIYLTTPGEY